MIIFRVIAVRNEWHSSALSLRRSAIAGITPIWSGILSRWTACLDTVAWSSGLPLIMWWNDLGNIVFVCNCCGFLDLLKRVKAITTLTHSNVQDSIASESCTGCGDCLKRYPLDALRLVEGIASIGSNQCLGCGNCIMTCPTGSLSVVRRAKGIPPKDDREFPGMGV